MMKPFFLPITLTSSADTTEVPLTLTVSTETLARTRPSSPGTLTIPCQDEPLGGGQHRLTFLCPPLAKNAVKSVVLTPEKNERVGVKQVGKNVEIVVGGALFTRYDTTTGPNKPYLYPLLSFGGKHLTRRWPVEATDPKEERDHPHHRGLWFTHGEMNGFDFWTEEPKPNHPLGKTVNTGYTALVSGPVQGRLEATTDWIADSGKTIARDSRTILVTPLTGGATLLDFSITVTAVGGPLHWGDSKEGTFALRVAESMRADKPSQGTLVNAEGLTNATLWGKPSPWNDYFGPVEGETLGIAIFDHPMNLRYPTMWHSRTYGLYAANPFGIHDFDPARKNDRHAGDLITPEGKSVQFQYRVYLHRGDSKSAQVAQNFSAWTTPPTVMVGRA